jgi:hypothetical protein
MITGLKLPTPKIQNTTQELQFKNIQDDTAEGC